MKKTKGNSGNKKEGDIKDEGMKDDMEVDSPDLTIIEEIVIKEKQFKPVRGLTHTMILKLLTYMEDHPEVNIGIPSIHAAAAHIREATLSLKASFWPALYGATDYLSVIFTSTTADGALGPTLIVKYAQFAEGAYTNLQDEEVKTHKRLLSVLRG